MKNQIKMQVFHMLFLLHKEILHTACNNIKAECIKKNQRYS